MTEPGTAGMAAGERSGQRGPGQGTAGLKICDECTARSALLAGLASAIERGWIAGS